jgi:serine/threonine protein kinase
MSLCNFDLVDMLDKFIGRGTFGEVYLSRGRAAKKIFTTDVELVRHEIAEFKKIHSTYIIKFYDIEIYENYIIMISDYAENGNLASILKNQDILVSWNMKRILVGEIINGLTFLHSNNIVHRNLKSSNILFNGDREIKLCDFGLASIKARSVTTSSNIRWMAPELFSIKPQYSTQSDIYSLGMVMWEISARKTLPFEDVSDNFVIMKCVQSGEREMIPDDTPSDYAETIKRCWYQNPDERHIWRDDLDILVEMENLNVREHDDYELALHYLESKDYNKALELFYVCAKRGDADAQYQLARIYHYTKRNYIKAYKWYRRLAGQNNATGQLGLGMLYEDWQNPAKAFKWYMKSANQNNSKAQCQVARMYKYGHGVKTNYHLAFKWYSKAAEQNNPAACYNIGYFYERGYVVQKNYAEAMKWYKK